MSFQTTPRIWELALEIAEGRRPPVIEFNEYCTLTWLDLEELHDALALLAARIKLAVISKPND